MAVPVEDLLLPRPRRARLDGATRVVASGTVRDVSDASLPPQGYRLTIGGDGGVEVAASDDSGRFYARATLAQLERTVGDGALPVGVVEDWPDLAVRGVMLDVSRTKVPTLDTLFGLIDRLASWKVNHVELYMEHTFAYPGHETVWAGADPYDAADLARLAAFCRERHVELTPNQNCLGHMERWLVHDRYAPLGLSRGVTSGPMGMPFPASTIDPALPGSLALARDLFGTLGSALPGARFHVGLDEPWDLPDERAADWRTWLDTLRGLPELSDRELLVWGDMVAAHPELLAHLPDGVTVCEWGYESNHPFVDRGRVLADAGATHWVCPGTSSWMSVLGRTTNAIEGSRAAAGAAASTGASGMLVTDWGDFGHLQHLPVSDPGLAAAAAFSWCAAANDDLDASRIGALLDVHDFGDEAARVGRALVTLGDVHSLQPCAIPNMSFLVLPLYFPQLPLGPGLGGEIGPAHVEAVEAAIGSALDDLAAAKPGTGHGQLAVEELRTGAELVSVVWRDIRARLGGDGTLAGIPADVRRSLADDTDTMVDAHRQRWLARNRPGGLDESCRWLTHLRDCYTQGEADDDWAGPLVERIRQQAAT
ncbi:MAG TPA: glycoside hydrolase family 20 zincin-like fold domain-containing protein [Acidimicrobiales bacterium]|nr:glycoside hydrolase family 20 zincin-like fold domain-containing protein [Acidimicrobiales bacterium]